MRVVTVLLALVGFAGLGLTDAGAGLGRQAAPPGVAGAWDGAIDVGGMSLTIAVVFTETPGGLTATIDIPQQGARGLALRGVRHEGARVHFELPAGPGLAVFDGTLAGDAISGDFTQGPAKGTFHLGRRAAAEAAAAAAPPPPYREQDVTFQNGTITLAGTLTVPDGKGPFPALVMITGSGPQNRDEELFGFKPFKVLADGLARAGIATLRYDDRGVGGSSGADSNPTTEDYAGDALAGVALLAARPEIRRAAIGLLGHSEGAVVSAIAAARTADVAFIVMMAGSAIPGDRVLRDQASDLARASGASPDQLKRILDAHHALIEAIRAGAGPDVLATDVRALARAQIEALPDAQRPPADQIDAIIDRQMPAQLKAMQSRWMRFFVSFDPAPTLERVHCPVLALFGGKDMQVPPATNRAPLEAALARGGNRRVTVKVYPEANHLFIKAVTGNPAEYPTLEKVFVPGLVDDVAGWVAAVTRQPAGPL